MYFPYLYARQQELLALRDLAHVLATWRIAPVLEPTFADPKDLTRCLSALAGSNAPSYLVVNPSASNIADPAATWFPAVAPHLSMSALVYPVHQITNEHDAHELPRFLDTFGRGRTAISLRSAQIAPSALAAAVRGRDSVVFVHEDVNRNAYLDALGPAQSVLVGRRFNVQTRNAEYTGNEWFTDAHRTYIAQGHPGYSDYGPLAPNFKPGGGAAAAAAIHLTYLAKDHDIWIEHFVSDSLTRGDGNNTSKLGEATKKVAARVMSEPTKFVSSCGLNGFLAQHAAGEPTNLGTSKRQQLTHHLHTNAVALQDVTP